VTEQLYDPSLEQHREEIRNMNDLVKAFMESVEIDWTSAAGIDALRNQPAVPGYEPLDHATEIDIPGPSGAIPARVLRPERIDAVYLDIHGGGWAIGSAAEQDRSNWMLAEAANVATVSIDYRLAPEHPWPAGPDDCEAAALWVIEHAADEFGTDRLVIGGGSAGAHLTAVTLLRLRDRQGVDVAERFLGANLVFGAFDLGLTPSARHGEDLLVIPRPVIEKCVEYLLPGLDVDACRDPEHSPLYADLHDLPPALFTVGTLDPLLDDSMFMAARWAAAGNRAELAVYPDAPHGFMSLPTEMARLGRERIHEFVASVVTAASPTPV
jgi:acetyl esterase/lipase